MDVLHTLLAADGDALGSAGPNLWGMLGCAAAYAAALIALVDAIADFLINRGDANATAVHALRLKTGGKVGAAALTVITAGVVLLLDSNFLALAIFSLMFIGVLLWVFYVYREGATRPPANTPG